MRKQFFFKSGRHRLFGSLHLPSDGQVKFGIIFLHPFAEEKVTSHKASVNLANALEKENIACFRFDFVGNGDSEGNFKEFTIEKALENLRDAMVVFKNETGISSRIMAILGLRLGGTISLIAGEKITDVENVVALSPIIDGRSYFNMLLRSNLAYQMSTYKKIMRTREALVQDLERNIPVNIDGYLVPKSLYKQLVAINLLDMQPGNLRNVVLLGLSEGKKRPSGQLSALNNLLRSNGVASEVEYIKDRCVWKPSEIYDMNLAGTANYILEWNSRVFR